MRNGYALVFLLLGFGSGAATATIYCRSHPDRTATYIPSRSEQVDAMADEIGLDEAQRARVHEISNRTHGDLAKIRESVAPALAAIRSDVRSQIRAVLTNDEQRRKFDTYCTRRDLQRAHADD
jgi:hypothetical protein